MGDKHLGKPKGAKDRPHVPQEFVLRFRDGGWQVNHGKNWVKATEVSVQAMVLTRPNGELYGLGVVSRLGSVLRITA